MAMPEGELRGTVADGVVTDGEMGCFYGDQFIFSGALLENIVFDNAIAIGQAESAEPELQRFVEAHLN